MNLWLVKQDDNVSHLGPASAVTRYCPLWALTTPSRTSQWVTHPKNALVPFSLNFEVPTEPEASELSKGLVLYGGGHVHIRHRGSTPLGDVGSNTTICL
ncbi:hypothetical protein DVH24_016557 [Malus domestica]|uniref:Uncharacterized protein n=1 Tax=Malus domestica TaxID=3750 RepID=A0A498HW33_MALDO|nr:hypothetical protein DVH24_016557 [Malus domestica]